jgi:predicted glycoside hydrolase/deacetylase ChbG (UPF0249 family)
MKMVSVRRLVLHADDFGMNPQVNQGILLAFHKGVLTSTSLLSNAPAADAACREWNFLVHQQQSAQLESSRTRRDLGDSQFPFDLGIHLNLTQGKPLTGRRFPGELLDRDGNFPGIGRLFLRLNRVTGQAISAVTAELRAQIEWMCDHGLRPSHLNGHQYIEMIPAIAAIIPDLLSRYSIPIVRVANEPALVRNVLFRGRISGWGLGMVKQHYGNRFQRRMIDARAAFPDRFFGTSHAGRIDRRTFEQFLSSDLEGLTEIGMHPGLMPDHVDVDANPAWHDPLALMRTTELDWLCDPELPKLLKRHGLTLGRLQTLAAVPLKAAG